MSDKGHMCLILTHNHCRKNCDVGWKTSDESVGNMQMLPIYTFVQIKSEKERGFSKHLLSYTPLFELLIGASRCVLALFSLSNNFSFLFFSHYTTFEAKTLQFTETFDKKCGKEISRFLWNYI
jgi:hypothetical protein